MAKFVWVRSAPLFAAETTSLRRKLLCFNMISPKTHDSPTTVLSKAKSGVGRQFESDSRSFHIGVCCANAQPWCVAPCEVGIWAHRRCPLALHSGDGRRRSTNRE